jgi:HEAT repeat protein
MKGSKRLLLVLLVIAVAATVIVLRSKHTPAPAPESPPPDHAAQSHPAAPAPVVPPPATVAEHPTATQPSATPSVAPSTPPALPTPPVAKADTPPSYSAAVNAAVERFKDASIPIEERMNDVQALARKGDAEAIGTLMALGSEDTYLNYLAVEALAKAKSADVAPYLQAKLQDRDPRIISAAVKGLSAQLGETAVPDIAKTMVANRKRDDGYQDTVCAACVDALAATQSSTAIPALGAELADTVGYTLQHDYGSRVVQALKTIDDSAAKPALEAYVARLKQQLAGMSGHPMGETYLKGKIDEAMKVIDELGKQAASGQLSP